MQLREQVGKSEKIGGGRTLDSLVCSSELGLPRRKKVGVVVDLDIIVILGYSLLIFYPCNRNLLSALSLPDIVLGRRGSKISAPQSLP